MRWRVVHLAVLVFAAAVALGIYRAFWGPNYLNAKVAFGGYLASVVAASIGAYSSKPYWRRLWLGYAGFGWGWIALVLRHFLGLVPDVYAEPLIRYCALGAALGVLCALASQSLPGMRVQDDGGSP